MILRLSLAALAVSSAPLAHAVTAAPPCAYAAHQPSNLKAILDEGFDAAGLYYLPQGYGGLGEGYGGTSLFRKDAVVAQIKFSQDPAKDSQDLLVTDARGQWLLKAKQRVHRCNDSLCRDLSITPRREVNGTEHPLPTDDGTPDDGDGQGQGDTPDVPQDHAPFFLRFASPGGHPVSAYVYGQLVETRQFNAMLADAMGWVQTAIATTDVAQPVIVAEGVNKLGFALVQDALLRPYFSLVKYTVDERKHVAIDGKVPSDETYGRAIDLARAQGYVVTAINLTIDERLRRLPVPLPEPVSCRN